MVSSFSIFFFCILIHLSLLSCFLFLLPFLTFQKSWSFFIHAKFFYIFILYFIYAHLFTTSSSLSFPPIKTSFLNFSFLFKHFSFSFSFLQHYLFSVFFNLLSFVSSDMFFFISFSIYWFLSAFSYFCLLHFINCYSFSFVFHSNLLSSLVKFTFFFFSHFILFIFLFIYSWTYTLLLYVFCLIFSIYSLFLNILFSCIYLETNYRFSIVFISWRCLLKTNKQSCFFLTDKNSLFASSFKCLFLLPLSSLF